MKESPMLFSAAMVRAILAGTKTQTRRIIDPRHLPQSYRLDFENGHLKFSERIRGCWHVAKKISCPYGMPGDRIWVRETWAHFNLWIPGPQGFGRIVYRADGNDQGQKDKWRASIHMPHWACRIILEIASVRVERLIQITEDDAEAEGAMDWWRSLPIAEQSRLFNGEIVPYAAFEMLWDSTYGEGSFGASPWVWVIEFKMIQN